MPVLREVNPRRIYKARLAAGMSQGDLAHAIRSLTGRKTTERSVRNWERGAASGGNAPHADVIPAIASATGVDLTWLYDADTGDEGEESRAVRAERIRAELARSGRTDLVADLEALVKP